MLAGIYGEEPPLKGSTLSRCIQIGLRRRYDQKEVVADFEADEAEAQAVPIAHALRRWALLTSHDGLRKARPVLPSELTDRQRDAWRPLVVVADLIGAAWGHTARRWAVELSQAITVTPDPMIQLLSDVYRVLVNPEHGSARTITTARLAAARNALPDREHEEDLAPIQLAKRLARFHLVPERYYECGHQVRGFRVRNDRGEFLPAWRDVIGRYRLSGPVLSVASVLVRRPTYRSL